MAPGRCQKTPSLLEGKLVQPLWKTVWRFLKKLKKENYPVIQQPHCWTCIWKRQNLQFEKMFTAALFTIAET